MLDSYVDADFAGHFPLSNANHDPESVKLRREGFVDALGTIPVPGTSNPQTEMALSTRDWNS